MDIQTLSNVINNFLRDVNKDLKIQKLTVTQEKLYVEYEPQEIDVISEPEVAPRKIKRDFGQHNLKIARSRARDPRVKMLLEANSDDTFESWLEREYPQVNISSVRNVMRKNPELPIRRCIELLKVRS